MFAFYLKAHIGEQALSQSSKSTKRSHTLTRMKDEALQKGIELWLVCSSPPLDSLDNTAPAGSSPVFGRKLCH